MVVKLSILIIISIFITACSNGQKSTPNNSQQSKESPQSFKGFYVTHEFIKTIPVDSYIKNQPEGSVDYLEMEGVNPYIIGVANVFLPVDSNSSAQPEFETKFRT